MRSSTLERRNAGAIRSAFRHTARRLLQRVKPARAGIASLISIAAAALCAPVQANQVIATITGTVSSGTDRTGAFGFTPGAPLAGQSFTITYIVDDTKGQQGVYSSNGAPYGSYIQNAGLNNPITAVLTIHNTSITFGTRPITSVTSRATRQVTPSFDSVNFYLADVYTNTGGGDQLGVDISIPSSSTAFTKDYQWQSGLSYTVCCGGSGSGEFDLTLKQQSAYGYLNPQTIAVGGLTCSSAGSIEVAAAAGLSCSLQPPAIYLGSDCLSGTKITAPQFVVVGQQIKLAACPASSNKAEPWSDPGNTIGDYEIKNGQTTTMCVGSSCAPGMTVPTDFANINEITFYWYAAGEYKIYYYGTAGTASATVIVGAPSGVTLSPITRTPHVYYVVKAQNWALDCGDTSQATDRNCINLALNDKPQRYTLPPGVAGQFQFLQIVNCDIRSHTTSGQQNCPSSPVGQLDNSFPYASVSDQIVGIDGAMHYGAGDAPCMELLPNWSQASRQFQATMYLMWNPNLTHSIPVPLGHFKWSWHGNATMNAGSWCPDRAQQCVAGPLVDTYDDFIPATPALTDFPTWNTVYSNVPSNTPTNDPCTLLKQN